MRTLYRSLAVAACVLAAGDPAIAGPTAIEYFHVGYGHYCVTSSPPEIAALDAGVLPGWSRTGEAFDVIDVGAPGSATVYRFWSGQTFAPKSSHFLTSIAAECAILLNNRDWTYEGEVFALKPADAVGTCPGGTLPLFRMYNNGASGAPNHRYTTQPAIRQQMLADGWTAEGAGVGVIGCVTAAVEPQVISGHVVAGGYIELALACHDANRNGRCDASEPQAYTDASGAYRLALAPGSEPAPLVAEIVAGRARDGGAAVEASYRMASPAQAYGTAITPFATLVHLTGLTDYRLAEDLVRATLGMPPYFDIALSAPAAAGSLKQNAAKAVASALKAKGMTLDLSAPDALAAVVAAFPAALTDLPQLRIATKDGVPIVSKEDYVDATYVLTHPLATVPTVTVNGKIRGRGHSTWGQPKNPYKVQFASDASYAAIADVLGMKKQRNWALLADWFDPSLIRNKLALTMGSSSVFADGLKWTPSGQHLEVWLNADYVGVYLLTEDIRIDAARLNIKKMSSNPATGDVDGGYIAEVDLRLDCYAGDDMSLQLVTPQQVHICVDTPDEDAITQAQLAYIKGLLVQVETDLYGPRTIAGINPVSFADWYLLQEFVRNNDAQFFSSDYMWKDTAASAQAKDRLLNMGPLWDFDRSMGFDNASSLGCWVSKAYIPNWIAALLDQPDFLSLTLARWKQKRPALEIFVNRAIDVFAGRVAAAAQRNFQRWPVDSTYAANVAVVKRFLNERMIWLDNAYENPHAFEIYCK
ncbi:MAG: CotH kinase family protein [Burkholderiales bacterium]